jgi:hypothetical protein
MQYPLQAMVQLGVIPPVTFPPDSRHSFGVQQYQPPGGVGHAANNGPTLVKRLGI